MYLQSLVDSLHLWVRCGQGFTWMGICILQGRLVTTSVVHRILEQQSSGREVRELFDLSTNAAPQFFLTLQRRLSMFLWALRLGESKSTFKSSKNKQCRYFVLLSSFSFSFLYNLKTFGLIFSSANIVIECNKLENQVEIAPSPKWRA